MLVLDAATDPPTHALTFTTSKAETPAAEFRIATANVWERLRRHLDRAEYFTRIEFTTGTAARSGGHRRIHSHSAAKLSGTITAEEVEELARDSWSKSTGAWIVGCRPLRTAAGALHYLSLHHAKAEQSPPSWWSGRTERVSRGYWSQPATELRAEAALQLHAERLAYRTGVDVDDARFLAEQQRAEWLELKAAKQAWRDATRWSAAPITQEADLLLFSDEDIPF